MFYCTVTSILDLFFFFFLQINGWRNWPDLQFRKHQHYVFSFVMITNDGNSVQSLSIYLLSVIAISWRDTICYTPHSIWLNFSFSLARQFTKGENPTSNNQTTTRILKWTDTAQSFSHYLQYFKVLRSQKNWALMLAYENNKIIADIKNMKITITWPAY